MGNESNKCSYYFADKLNLKNPNKNITLIHLGIYTFTHLVCIKQQ